MHAYQVSSPVVLVLESLSSEEVTLLRLFIIAVYKHALFCFDAGDQIHYA